MIKDDSDKEKIITAAIIGSGIAGIACAIRLKQLGYKVIIFESSEVPGGKIGEREKDGFRFDTGPSLLTLPELIDELFLLCKRNPNDYFRYHRLDLICKYFYDDGTIIKAWANPQKFADEIERTTGEPSFKVLKYLNESKILFELTAPVFLQRPLQLLSALTKASSWKALINLYRLDSNTSLHNRNRSRFRSQKVVQLFDRYATYNGSDPFVAPATLKVIPHLEFNTGAFFPIGGMRSIIDSIVQLALDIGVEFQLNSKVEKLVIENNAVKGIEVKGNSGVKQFDLVVSNMDIVNTYSKLLPAIKNYPKSVTQTRSTSALVFYWGMKKEFSQLELHNIFFSSDYKKEFDFLTNRKEIYSDPTVYINISSKEKKNDAPADCENWFVMINAPHLNGQNWNDLIAMARENIITKISSVLLTDIRPLIISESILDPRDIESQTSSYQGALYGSSSNNRYAAFLRHKNFSSKIRNLYFCGGSVHPGGGIPLCLYSAKIVADIIGKQKKFRPVN